jgi:uncharacterized protein YciI
MLYALICTDKPDHLQVRLDNRPDHVAYLKGLGDALKGAGPFLGEDGKPIGSLVLIEAENQTSIEAIAANDPYAKGRAVCECRHPTLGLALEEPRHQP